MKKIILSLVVLLLTFQIAPVFAQDASSTRNKKDKKGEVDLVCMQNAVVKRDNAVISAIDVYVVAVRRAIETRRDALKAAWTIADKQTRKEALKTALDNDKNSRKSARQAFKKLKDAAWNVFRTDRKVCRDKGDGDEGKNASHDDL